VFLFHCCFWLWLLCGCCVWFGGDGWKRWMMLNVVWLCCDLEEVGFVHDVVDDWRKWRWCCVSFCFSLFLFFFFLLFMKLLLFLSTKDICWEAHQKISKLKAKGDTNLYLFFFVCE
jgi:hypothetical protein